MANKIKVFSLELNETGYIKEIEDTLKASQIEVGGRIQIISLDEKGELDLYVNDEGKINGLPANRVWMNEHDEIIDIVCGNAFVARSDREGNTISIRESDIDFINKTLLPFVAKTGNTVILNKAGSVTWVHL